MKKYPLLFRLALALRVKDGLNGFYFMPLKIKGKDWDFRYVIDRENATVTLLFYRCEGRSPVCTALLAPSGEIAAAGVRRGSASTQGPSKAIPPLSLFVENAQKAMVGLAMCSPENKACAKLLKQACFKSACAA